MMSSSLVDQPQETTRSGQRTHDGRLQICPTFGCGLGHTMDCQRKIIRNCGESALSASDQSKPNNRVDGFGKPILPSKGIVFKQWKNWCFTPEKRCQPPSLVRKVGQVSCPGRPTHEPAVPAWKSRIRLAFDLDRGFLMDGRAAGWCRCVENTDAQRQNTRPRCARGRDTVRSGSVRITTDVAGQQVTCSLTSSSNSSGRRLRIVKFG